MPLDDEHATGMVSSRGFFIFKRSKFNVRKQNEIVIIIEVSSDREIRELVQMVKLMKNRKSSLRPFFQALLLE